jgi:hypothetical protein
MQVNRAAIDGSRPWSGGPDGRVTGAGVRFTVVDGAVHALVDATDAAEIALRGVRADAVGGATVLSTGAALDVQDVDGVPWLRLPEARPAEPVHAIRLHGDVRPA